MVPTIAAPYPPIESLVLTVPMFEPFAERFRAPPRAARALVNLRAAQAAMSAAREHAGEAAEGLAVAEALHACRLAASREVIAAEARERATRARLFDAEFDLAMATMEVFAATEHVGRIAIRAGD
jgi:hypothetical protein